MTAYSYSHAFVTNWVKQNKPMAHLCELLNTSEAMVRPHYPHLFEDASALRDELDPFTAGAPVPPRSLPGTTA